MTISPALFPAVIVTVVRRWKILPAPGTNQIAGFSGYHPLTIKEINKFLLLFGRHVCVPLEGHKHGVSIQSSINLGDTLLQITRD